MHYEPNEPVSDLVGGFVNAYWNGYRDHWSLQNVVAGQEEEVAFRERVDQLGQAIRESVHSLTAQPAVVSGVIGLLADTPGAISDRAKAIAFAKLISTGGMVKDSIAITLAFEATDALATAEQRIGTLIEKLAERELTPRALAYLDRATRLFLWGFDAECVVMCRSVLEAALLSRLDQLVQLDEPPPPLEALIRMAGESGLLAGLERTTSRRGWRARKGTDIWRAERIRWAGNQVVHDMPTLVGHRPHDLATADEVLDELTRVLALLCT